MYPGKVLEDVANIQEITSIEHDETLGAKKVKVVNADPITLSGEVTNQDLSDLKNSSENFISTKNLPTTKTSGIFTFSNTNPKQFSATSVPYCELHLVPKAADGVSYPVGSFYWGYSSETCVHSFTDYADFTGLSTGDFNELYFAATNATDKLYWNAAHYA